MDAERHSEVHSLCNILEERARDAVMDKAETLVTPAPALAVLFVQRETKRGPA